MSKRPWAYLASTATVVASAACAAPPTEAPTTHRVRPGESIQKAVDAAKPGHVILLGPGTYRESVTIRTPGLTLRGSGDRGTVITPGAVGSGASACAKAGNGICVTGTDSRPVAGVTVRSLVLRGFAKNGLWASGTDRLTVQKVTSEGNGQWGIAQEKSVRGVFRHNTAEGNADAGIFVSNTVTTEEGARDADGAVISNNRVVGNRIGVTVRRLRNLSVDHNEMTGNCAALFVVGDESLPRAGAMRVHSNYIHANNKYCPKTPRLPFLQGSGIVLTGAEETLVMKNRVEDNAGTSPLSGGIVLFKSFVGALNQRNEIRDNVVLRNTTADLANRDVGKGNTFQDNRCAVSEPAGMC